MRLTTKYNDPENLRAGFFVGWPGLWPLCWENVLAVFGWPLSFLLAAKEKNEYFGEKTTYNFTDDVRKVQLGYHIALAYKHHKSGLEGFLRWNAGFTKVPTSEYDTNIKNAGFSVGARYRINHLFYNK